MAEDRGFAEGAFQFFAKVGATYRWLRRRVGVVLAVLVLVVGAGVLGWWNWNELISRPGVDRAVQWFQPETFPVPVLGQLNVAVALFEGDTADEQRRRVILDELRKIPGVAVLPIPSPVGAVDAIQSAAAEWSEHFEASVYIGGKVRDVHGRKLVDLIWFAPAPPQEHWTTIDHLIRDEVTLIPAAGPEHLKALLPIMVEARMIDARDTLDEEFRKQYDDAQFEAASKNVESASLQWSDPMRRAARGVLAQAYAAHRPGLHSRFLQKSVDLYAQLDREEPNTLWGERMADSLQRLGTFASGVHVRQIQWRAQVRENGENLRKRESVFGSLPSWAEHKPDGVDRCKQIAEQGMGFGWSPSTSLLSVRPAPPVPRDSIGRPIPQPPGPSKSLQESVDSFAQALKSYESTGLWSHALFAGDENKVAENKQKTAIARANFDAALPKLLEAVEADLGRLQAMSAPPTTMTGPDGRTYPIISFGQPREKKEASRAERRMAEIATILSECRNAFTGTTPFGWRSMDQQRVVDDESLVPGSWRAQRKRDAATAIVEELRWEIGRQQLEAAITAYRRSLGANVTHPAASDVAITQNNLAVALQASGSGEAKEMYLAAYNDLSARPDRRATIVKRSLDRISTPAAQ